MADLTGMLQAAAGAAGGENLYIEDVFSTYLYTGNGSTQTITNGIDLDGEGGLVWIKSRSAATNHQLFDTERGATKELVTNNSDAEATDADTLTAFNSNGFALGADSNTNTSAATYASWAFRKAPKFFDCLTYTGTGSSGLTVSHNLGSVPGFIIVKDIANANNWCIYHRSTGATKAFYFSDGAEITSSVFWNDTAPTDSVFTLGNGSPLNVNGRTYVAYLFAHDAGGFGDDGSENVITCGSYTGNGSTTGPTITLGYEPQWVLIKRASNAGNDWVLFDNMRGMPVGSVDSFLRPNTSQAEDSLTDYLSPTATGFNIVSASSNVNTSANTYIYIAIRRGPMKTPTAGTEVFSPVVRAGTGAAASVSSVGFPPDLTTLKVRNGGSQYNFIDRLRGREVLYSTSSMAAITLNAGVDTAMESNVGFSFIGSPENVDCNYSGQNDVYHNFRRAPGFFDVVCYTGTGSATTITHNLGVVPELIIVKNRDQADAWQVYAGDATDYLVLNTTAATADNVDRWNDTAPTSSVFTIGTAVEVNTSTEKYVAYLFASLAGVSKVGSYTGNGSSVTVTTGFQPRFILVKRTDSTGNWIVGDSARGLVAADEPALFLNSTAAETTGQDWVDISATGFTVNETALNANVSTATYIYLCVS